MTERSPAWGAPHAFIKCDFIENPEDIYGYCWCEFNASYGSRAIKICHCECHEDLNPRRMR